jgi:hypothetical protein
MTVVQGRTALVAATAAALLLVQAGAAAAPVVEFRIAATTGLKLTDVVWTGTRFLYVDNTTNRVFAARPDGTGQHLFARMPKVAEETRCVPSPGRYGFPAGGVFCHLPSNAVYRISATGVARLFATLPESGVSDGAIAFDGVGRFGHRLIAVTGKSGGHGGRVYTVDATGKVVKVGAYPGPGGADNVVVAPATFGAQAGSALLSMDAIHSGGVVAVDPSGQATTIARLPDGANPIAVIPQRFRNGGVPAPGFYVVDTFPGTVLVADARQFAGHGGSVLVGTELKGQIWLVTPTANGYRTTRLATSLKAGAYNLEGARFVP